MDKSMSQEAARSITRAIPTLVGLPAQKYWVDYDREADVLYVSFDRPQKATDTEMTDDGLLFRYRDDNLIGVTILNASTRTEEVRQTSPLRSGM